MTRLEQIRRLDAEQLAELLIQPIEINEGDYDYDENLIDWYVSYWKCPDGYLVYDDDYHEAVKHTAKWLISDGDIFDDNDEYEEMYM